MQEKEIIFGAPGCGKTTYLMSILEKELERYAPERIAFVSHTRKGAYEGLDRAIEKFGYVEDNFPYFKTLHAICFKELRMSRYDMVGKKDYKVFSQAMNMNFIGYYSEEFKHNDDQFLHLYFLKHNNYAMYEKMRDAAQINVNKLKHVAHNYVRYKEKFRKYDFTDLLKNVLKQGTVLDVDVAIIDEAQDLTTLQWQVCEQLFKNAKKVYIAGDDDQAIYEWSGADVHYFLGIKGKRTILDTSWRLKTELLTFAKKLSSHIVERVDKDFHANAVGGNVIFYNDLKDFEFNPAETYYCLARNNYYLSRYTDECKKQLLLFDYKGTPSVSKETVKAINDFDKYKKKELDDRSAMNVTKHLKKDIKNIESLAWYEAFNMSAADQLYYRQLIQHKVELHAPKIHINTIHGVKGGEADNVILFMDVTKTVYEHLYKMADSELRVLYVACTRARTNLHIIYEQSKYGYSHIFKELTDDNNL